MNNVDLFHKQKIDEYNNCLKIESLLNCKPDEIVEKIQKGEINSELITKITTYLRSVDTVDHIGASMTLIRISLTDPSSPEEEKTIISAKNALKKTIPLETFPDKDVLNAEFISSLIENETNTEKMIFILKIISHLLKKRTSFISFDDFPPPLVLHIFQISEELNKPKVIFNFLQRIQHLPEDFIPIVMQVLQTTLNSTDGKLFPLAIMALCYPCVIETNIPKEIDYSEFQQNSANFPVKFDPMLVILCKQKGVPILVSDEFIQRSLNLETTPEMIMDPINCLMEVVLLIFRRFDEMPPELQVQALDKIDELTEKLGFEKTTFLVDAICSLPPEVFFDRTELISFMLTYLSEGILQEQILLCLGTFLIHVVEQGRTDLMEKFFAEISDHYDEISEVAQSDKAEVANIATMLLGLLNSESED